MKKTMIRLLSLMLCLVTLVSLLPVSVVAATTLGAPKNLTINKEYNFQSRKLVTKYGSIAWQAQKPIVKNGSTSYEVSLYRNDKLVHSQRVGWPDWPDFDNKSSEYRSFDFSPYIENSGSYYATVRTVSDSSKYAASEKVTSAKWTYTQPSSRVEKPTKLNWDWPYAVWEGKGPFQIQMYYSPTKVDTLNEMQWFHTQSNIYDNANKPPRGDYGPGYYRFRVRTMSTNINSKYHSFWVTSDLYHFKMDTPSVSVTKASSGKPKVSWGSVKYAEKYEVYRATSKDGDYTKIKTTTSKAYTDEDASRGRTYYYKVRAVTGTGAKSSYSTPVFFTLKLSKPTVKVTNVASSGKIKLTWNAVSGAKGYEVYRATRENGDYTLVKTTTSTSYTNTTAKVGQRYYYKVKAIGRSSLANSDFSEVVTRMCDLARPTVKVSNLLDSGKIKLRWESVDGAIGYHVYRSTSKDGTYTRQSTITDGTSYTDTNAQDNLGRKYYYKVAATMDLQDEENASNSAKSEVVSKYSKLARPDVTVTRTSKGKPRLTWGTVRGAKEYQIYRATSKDGKYEKIKTVTGTSFNNTDAKAGKTYYYKVKAVCSNTNGNSAYSVVQSIKSK